MEKKKKCTRCGLFKDIEKSFSIVYNKRNKTEYVNNICRDCAKKTTDKKNEELKQTAKKPVVDFGNAEEVAKWNKDNSFKWTYAEEIG